MATDTAQKAPTKPRNTTHKCQCLTGTGSQCPGQTDNWFARGHDARMSSRLANAVGRGEVTVEQATEYMSKAGGSDLLIGKMQRAAKLLQEKAAKAAEPKPAKAAKPAKDKDEPSGDAEPDTSGAAQASNRKVTVMHGKRKYTAHVVRNAAGDDVARHSFAGNEHCDHDDLEV